MDSFNLTNTILIAVLLAVFVVPPIWTAVVFWDAYQDDRKFKASLSDDDINKIASSRLVGNRLFGWKNESYETLKRAWVLRQRG